MIRAIAAAFGVAFGFLLAWGGMSDPDAIRRMLLLEDAYLYLVFFSAVAISFAGVRLARRGLRRSIVTREPISWGTTRPEARHVGGSVLFGLGWAISSSCPGPIAAQLGQGLLWSGFTIAGIAIGVVIFMRRERRTVSSARREGPRAAALPVGR